MIHSHQIQQQASITTVHARDGRDETYGQQFSGSNTNGPAFMNTTITETDYGLDPVTEHSRATVKQEYTSYSFDENSHLRFDFTGSTSGEVAIAGTLDDEATIFDTTQVSFYINETAYLTLSASVTAEGALEPVSGHGDDLSDGTRIRNSTIQLDGHLDATSTGGTSTPPTDIEIFKIFDGDALFSIAALELAPGSYNLVTKSRYSVVGDPGETVQASTGYSLNFSLSSTSVIAVPEPGSALALFALLGGLAPLRFLGGRGAVGRLLKFGSV
ncbi:hypothetical protein [Rhodopirellula islandica]|uniref:hypothetical protein n=1 Tax=Rhodopirellula islandica TaxID=595434 RepID=UPI0015687C28|nr:hypothetical protein [Rhodopirellula islandica]